MTITTKFGVHEKKTPKQTASRFPGATVGREFIDEKDLPRPRDIRPDVQALADKWMELPDGECYLSFKPYAMDVATGGWSKPFAQLGKLLADYGGRVKPIIHHEPSDNMPGVAFATMFNRSRALIKSAYPDCCVVYCDQTYSWRPNGIAALNALSWQAVEWDEALADVYSGKTFPETADLSNHPGFINWFDNIVVPRMDINGDADWGLGERGYQSKDPAVRVLTMARDRVYLRNLLDAKREHPNLIKPPVVVIGWNTVGQEKNAGWLWDDAAVAEMRNMGEALTFIPEPPDPYAGFTEIGSVGPASDKTALYRHDASGLVTADRDKTLAGFPIPL